ncbi:MAG: hypothetical protein K2P59_16060, partial [Acetatifactor sp.]|nr:hypothetical protein [Acetatifactor sp.]
NPKNTGRNPKNTGRNPKNTGRNPKNQRFFGFASLVKWMNRHLREQARQMSVHPFDSALCGHYSIKQAKIKLFFPALSFCILFAHYFIFRRLRETQRHLISFAAFFARIQL